VTPPGANPDASLDSSRRPEHYHTCGELDLPQLHGRAPPRPFSQCGMEHRLRRTRPFERFESGPFDTPTACPLQSDVSLPKMAVSADFLEHWGRKSAIYGERSARRATFPPPRGFLCRLLLGGEVVGGIRREAEPRVQL
jgi:hypothetical protein